MKREMKEKHEDYSNVIEPSSLETMKSYLEVFSFSFIFENPNGSNC